MHKVLICWLAAKYICDFTRFVYLICWLHLVSFFFFFIYFTLLPLSNSGFYLPEVCSAKHFCNSTSYLIFTEVLKYEMWHWQHFLCLLRMTCWLKNARCSISDTALALISADILLILCGNKLENSFQNHYKKIVITWRQTIVRLPKLAMCRKICCEPCDFTSLQSIQLSSNMTCISCLWAL